MPYFYVLRSEQNGRFYVGSAVDVTDRLADHNRGNTPSTRPYRPWKLVYSETFATLPEARRRERQVKSWKNSAYMNKTLGLDK